MIYTAQAQKDERGWVVTCDQHPHLKVQVSRLEIASYTMQAAIAQITGADSEEIEVSIHPQIDPDMERELREAVAHHTDAEAKDARALAIRRSVAQDLSRQGFSVRDIGVILGISHQRAHQLVREADLALTK